MFGNGFLGLPSDTSWFDVAQQGFTDFLQFKKLDQQSNFLGGLTRSGQSGSIAFDAKGNPLYSVGGVGLSGGTLLLFGGAFLVILLAMFIGRR